MLSQALIIASLLCGTYGAAVRYAAPQQLYPQGPYTAPVAKAVYASDATPVVAYRGHAGPVVYAPKEEESSPVYLEYNLNPQYSYAYEVQDDHTGDSKGQQETRSGDVVKGSYKVVDPDGSKRTVEYTADDHNGFNAVVHREPAPTHSNAAAAPVSYFTYSKAALSATPVYVKAPAPVADRSPLYSKEAPTVYAAPIYANAAPVEYAPPVYAKVAPTAYSAPVYAKAAPAAYASPIYAKVTPVQYASPIYANVAAPVPHGGQIYVNTGIPYSPKQPVLVTKLVPSALQEPYVAPAVRYAAPQRKGFPKHGPITKYTGPLVLPAAANEARHVPYNIQATPVILAARYEGHQVPQVAYPSSTPHYS